MSADASKETSDTTNNAGPDHDATHRAIPGKAVSLDLRFPVFVRIEDTPSGFTVSVHQGDSEKYNGPFASPGLAKQAVPVSNRSWTLEKIVEAILRFRTDDLKKLDEYVQQETGRHLYGATLGLLPKPVRDRLGERENIDLRIETGNDWISSLPWGLLADGNLFLAAKRWSISISRCASTGTCELPPSPRLLVVAPQPAGVNETHADEHLEELENMLSSYDQRLSSGDHMKTVLTWTEYLSCVEDFKPHLVYYYGHGVGDGEKARLVFSKGPNLQRIDKPFADFAAPLRRLERPPVLAYINCCQGDAGGFLGAGAQLGDFVPAVISNRTVAQIPVAQAQAMAFWKNVLGHAVAPHKAAGNLYADMDRFGLGVSDVRWITPVFYAGYGAWKAKPPAQPDRLVQDPYWHLKIDRVKQYSIVIAQTRLMIREQKPKSHAFVWYGQQGQGVEIFHKRLYLELKEELPNVHVHQVRPRWPQHLESYHDAFEDVLTEALDVNHLDDVAGRLRHESNGKTTLLYVRHEPVLSANLINPESLKEYVRWWDAEFARLLEENQYGLLSVSFIVDNPPAFLQCVKEEKIDEQNLKSTVFWVLDEMEKVAKTDLLRFLHTHSIDLPEDRRDEVLQEILERTKGRYEQTVEELKLLRRNAWKAKKCPRPGKKKKTAKTWNY